MLFTPVRLGPIELRNRTIRAAAFESMCPNNAPSQQLYDYHTAVARGGIGMTTIAYAAVERSGLSFEKQLWLRPEVTSDLRNLTDAIHREGSKASIQLGHCGNMSHRRTAGQLPISASTGFNLYSPTWVRGMRAGEIKKMAQQFGHAVRLAKDSGFDAVEIHAGHGYLISQFLSPATNHRRDHYGRSLENRMRFMRETTHEVLTAAGSDTAVLFKMNMRDGFRGGMQLDESLQVAQTLQNDGAHALVLSGGFVSRAPMYVMQGSMPFKTLTHYMHPWWLRYMIKMGGRMMIKTHPFREGYFLDDALAFRRQLKVPLVYVGGLVSRAKIDQVLELGFDAVAMARSLVCAPDFVNQLAQGVERSECGHSNYCIARMYSQDMRCHRSMEQLPKKLQHEIARLDGR